MKKTPLLLLAAALLAACGAPAANNAPANRDPDTAKPAASAPTADALLALDRQANDAYFKGDAKYFETFLSDKFGWASGGKHMSKADVLKEVAGVKCDVKSFDLSEPQMSKIDDDTYAFTYKGTFDGACTENGKQDKLPSPVRGATIFVRSGDKWQAAWHGEQMVMEAAKDEKADTAKPADTKKEDAAKPADTKKEEAAKPADTAKKTDKVVPIGATKTAPANATGAQASTEAAKPDANTDALLKAETAGWNAWRDKDTKALDSFAAKTLAFVEPDGSYTGSRASVLEMWGRTSGCEGVKTVNLTNGFAWALSPTIELLTYDSTIDGTCQGQKNGPMHGMTVYIKEGDAWKATFGFVQPARKM